MPIKLPYMASPGSLPKILAKIQEARRPDRFTLDFLETKLGFSGGSARPIIPLLKRMGFVSADGTPTRLYDQFRNVATQGQAMASAIRSAYPEIFERNEYAQDLAKDKLTGLITEITGASKDDTTTKCTVATFCALKDLADFDTKPDAGQIAINRPAEQFSQNSEERNVNNNLDKSEEVNFAVSYTINLNLTETSNPDVFNAIFKALKENLLARK